MEWKGADAPVSRPIARVVADVGSPMDRVVADDDVTTFLNDRFHPVLRHPGLSADGVEAPADTVQFFTPRGCPLTLPLAIRTAPQFIAVANLVMYRHADERENSSDLAFECVSRSR